MRTSAVLLCPEDTSDAPDQWSAVPEEWPARRTSASTPRVLVVDDEPIVRSFIARLLEEMGYEVQVAHDGAEALRSALEHPGGFDLVITDVRMPAMDGWELGRRLRDRWPSLPVLYVSGYDLEGRTAGTAAFLRKPFDPPDLLDRVARLLRGA